jgi:hypothetical protein
MLRTDLDLNLPSGNVCEDGYNEYLEYGYKFALVLAHGINCSILRLKTVPNLKAYGTALLLSSICK